MTRAAIERPIEDLVGEMLERPISRRTILARGRDLGLTLAASSFLTACASAVASHRVVKPDPPRHTHPKYLVMIIIDAGRPDYFSYASLPNLKALMSRGTYYDRAWVGQLESTTPASHATIGSGCHPANNGGILGFWWEDPTTGTTFNSVPLDCSDPDSLAVIMANAGTPTMAEYLKRHDSRAKVYAASGQKWYAADAAGGVSADYISYFKSRDGDVWGPHCIDGQALPQDILGAQGLTKPTAQLRLGEQDALVGDLAIDVVRKERPRIVILNLPEMDWPVAHIDGGPLAPSAVATLMTNADQLLGKLTQEYEAAGILDQTVFMVLGDHGVTPLERFVNRYTVKSAMEQVGTVVSHDTHTGSFGWMEDASLAEAAAKAVEHANIPFISAVYYLTERNGRRTYTPAPNTAAATHETLGSAYLYLLQTVAGANAPHVVCFYPERTGTLNSGGPITPWRGDHGGASWAAQAVPVLIAGPGVRQAHVSHYPARLVDLAPTAMRLLGVPYPRTDGVVLSDCMSHPLGTDVSRQSATARYVVPYAAALRRQSARETAGLPAMKPTKNLPNTSLGKIGVGPTY